MAIPYAKIGPDQLDLEALSQRLIAENGIVTKASGIPSNIADSVEEIDGVSSSNIAKAHISEDDESYKWQSGFTDEENNKDQDPSNSVDDTKGKYDDWMNSLYDDLGINSKTGYPIVPLEELEDDKVLMNYKKPAYLRKNL